MGIFTKSSSVTFSGTLVACIFQASLLISMATSGVAYSQDSEARTLAERGGASTARSSSGGAGSTAITNLALGAALGSIGTNALNADKVSSKESEVYVVSPEKFFVEEKSGDDVLVKGVEHVGPSELSQNDLHSEKEKFRVCEEGKLRHMERNPSCVIKHAGFWKAKPDHIQRSSQLFLT